jgi:hypothetical protein
MKSFAPLCLGRHTDTEIPCNAPDANPFFSSGPNRRHLLGVCVLKAPTAKLGALVAGASYPGEYALTDHGAFELGKDAHHLKHRPAGRRRGIKALLEQINAFGMKFTEKAEPINGATLPARARGTSVSSVVVGSAPRNCFCCVVALGHSYPHA